MKKLLSLALAIVFGCSIATRAQQMQQVVNYLQSMPDKGNWTADDLSNLRFTNVYTDEQTGITHAYVQQQYINIPVYNAISAIALKNNAVVHAAPVLINHIAAKVNATKPVLQPHDAIVAAFNHLEIATQGKPVFNRFDAGKNMYYYQWNDYAHSAIEVQLVYQQLNNQLYLAYNVTIEMKNNTDWWNVRIDALKGQFLDKNNYVVHCEFNHDHNSICKDLSEAAPVSTPAKPLPLLPPPPASYNVFQAPLEAPTFGTRSIANNPHDSLASPYGWHDTDGVDGAEFTITRGNNVHAYEDANNDNFPGYAPDGTAGLNFNFSYDGSLAPINNQDASLTNLFYMNNIIHDVTYKNGFTDVAGNFQSNNYGRGGLGNDDVKAEGFDGGGVNNANFATPPDGSSGRMQMYLWTNPTPDADASFDNGIIAHEFGHGLSNRLTGGPSNTSCLTHSEQGGEGWSDWLALILTIEPGDSGAMGRGIGTYSLGQPTNGAGIRRFRYSTNMSINPQTYADLAGSSGPHQKGEIWCDAIWDMTWFLIEDLGFNPNPDSATSGNNIAMRLVIEGMKLQPCSPGYIDARNAILLADQLLYNNAHRCRIWQAFARRGMGYLASQGSVNSSTDQVADFSMPYFCSPPVNPPIAGFTANNTTIDCANSVIFNDTSYLPYSWFWDFGDGSTSVLQHPTHAYASPGVYTVKLVVTNPLGTDSVIKLNYIAVNPTFSISTTATPASICPGGQVQLDATVTGAIATNYNVTNIPFSPDTNSATTISLGDDVISSILPIGFNFNFYGNNYTDFYIGSNGYITFTPGQSVGPVYGPVLPSNGPPNNIIAAAWNDLLPTGPDISYTTVGTAPNRKLVVNYNVRHYLSATHIFKLQIQLHETTNIIELHTDTIPDVSSESGSATTTQGLENANGTQAVTVPGRNSQHFNADNDAYRFTPYLVINSQWNPGALNGLTQNVVPAASTIYSVTVNNGLGCTSTATVNVTVHNNPTPAISGNLAFCAGGSTLLDAGSYTNYQWSNGETTQTVSVNTAGAYTVTVTDVNGCTASVSATVIQHTLPTPAISGVLTFCAGNSTTLDAGLYVSYLWSNGETTQTVLINTAGTFTVTVTDANGCTASTSATTTVSSALMPGITGNTQICVGGNTTLLCNGVYDSYLWSNGNTTNSISVNVTGTYTITVSDNQGCTGTASATVTNYATVACNISGPAQYCSGSSVTWCSASANSYLWSNGSTNQCVVLNSANTYTVTVTSADGCTSSCSAQLSLATDPVVSISGASTFCTSTPTTLTATGGFVNYVWSNGSSNQTTLINSGGTYTVTVTNGLGCTASATLAVNGVSAAPATPGAISGNNTVCALSSGNYSIVPVAGATNYIWTVGSGATIASGQGTNAITVNFANNAVSANVSVVAGNVCGNSNASTLAYAVVSTLPLKPTVLSGPLYGRCKINNVAYSCTVMPGPVNYVWTVPAGVTIVSGQGTPNIVVNFTPAFTNVGTISVYTSNGCGNSAAQVRTVSARPQSPVISGPTSACPNQILTFTATPVAGATSYIWTVVPGSVIQSGQGTTTLVVKWGNVGGQMYCAANNSCGASVRSSKPVSIVCKEGFGGFSFSEIDLFPNPASNNVQLKLDAAKTGLLTIKVADLVGKVCLFEKADMQVGDNTFILDIETLAPGIYQVMVVQDGMMRTKKLVVQ